MSKAAAAEATPLKEFPGQHPGERVVLVFRQHPVILRRPIIYGLLAIAIGITPLDVITGGPAYGTLLKIALGIPLIVFIYWFYHWIGWYYSVFIVTDQRLIDIRQKGFFNREVKEVGFDKIQSINYHIKGIQAAILKFGDITVQAYTSNWVLKSIPHPEEVHSQMMQVAHTIVSTPPQK